MFSLSFCWFLSFQNPSATHFEISSAHENYYNTLRAPHTAQRSRRGWSDSSFYEKWPSVGTKLPPPPSSPTQGLDKYINSNGPCSFQHNNKKKIIKTFLSSFSSYLFYSFIIASSLCDFFPFQHFTYTPSFFYSPLLLCLCVPTHSSRAPSGQQNGECLRAWPRPWVSFVRKKICIRYQFWCMWHVYESLIAMRCQ